MAELRELRKDTGRFISEFGFQGAPHPETIEFSQNLRKEIFHPVMLKHNKQVEGQERLIRFIFGNFGKCKDFDSFVYLSQLNQAEAIKFGVEHWRSRKYKTAGTLFWQLNDSWPVFSWSAVDYFKRPKALYYYAEILCGSSTRFEEERKQNRTFGGERSEGDEGGLSQACGL